MPKGAIPLSAGQDEKEHVKYDQPNVSQWEFHIVPRSVLAATGLKSLGIAKVRELSGGSTRWADLAESVTVAAADQRRDDDPPWWEQLGPLQPSCPLKNYYWSVNGWSWSASDR